MITFKRICIKDLTIEADNATVEFKRGKEYITSEEIGHRVTIFTTYWVSLSIDMVDEHFAGAVLFTGSGE